jgi:hypothetical protein
VIFSIRGSKEGILEEMKPSESDHAFMVLSMKPCKNLILTVSDWVDIAIHLTTKG